MTTSSYRVLALAFLRPLTLAALVLGLEVMGVLAAAGAECLISALVLAIWTPYSASTRGPDGLREDLDGFSASWPARPEPAEEEPSLPALVSAIWAAVGLVPVVALTLWWVGEVSGDAGAAIVIACLMAIPVFIAQFSAMWILRAIMNSLRDRGELTVEQSGRVLIVGEKRWTRSGADHIEDAAGVLQISRGDAAIDIPGGARCREWLSERLEQTRPPDEDAVVPEALAAMRAQR